MPSHKVCGSVQAASKLSSIVLAWHTQAVSNFESGKAAWEQFSLLAAFKPETHQDAAHSDSAHTEATHAEALHMNPAHVCPEEPFRKNGCSMAVDDETALTVQNGSDADGSPESAAAAMPQKQRGRPKRSRSKHVTVSTAETGASAAAATGATGFAWSAAANLECKQPPRGPRQTPARKCKFKMSNQQADGGNALEQAHVRTHVRSLAPQHKGQRWA